MFAFDVPYNKGFFQDIGDSEDNGAALLLRTQLLRAIKNELKARNWTEREAAAKLGVRQPKISEIYALRIDKFSAELLVKYLSRLGKEVSLTVKRPLY